MAKKTKKKIDVRAPDPDVDTGVTAAAVPLQPTAVEDSPLEVAQEPELPEEISSSPPSEDDSLLEDEQAPELPGDIEMTEIRHAPPHIEDGSPTEGEDPASNVRCLWAINLFATLKRWFGIAKKPVIILIKVFLSAFDFGTDIINGINFISGGEKS